MRPSFTQGLNFDPPRPLVGGGIRPRIRVWGNKLPPAGAFLKPTPWPRFPRNGLLLAFLAGFAVGYVIGEMLPLGPWAQPRTPLDPQPPGVGELDPTNYGGANSPVPPSMLPVPAPPWWPTGSIAVAGVTAEGHRVTATYTSGNGIQSVITTQRTNEIQDLGRIDVVSDGNSYQMYNVKNNGERILIDQLSGSNIANVTVTQVTVGPKVEGSPSNPYPQFQPSDTATGGRPGGFTPSPQEMPRTAPIRTKPAPGAKPQTVPQTAPETLPLRSPPSPTLPKRPAVPGTIPKPPPGPIEPLTPAKMPLPGPIRIPLLPNGDPAPDPGPRPTPWPPGLEVPWPEAGPIGQPAQQPRPDLPSIARELGRLEQKLSALGSGKGGPDLASLLEELSNLFPDPPPYNYPAGSYSLAPICDRDENGGLIEPLVSSWPAGVGELAEVRRKVDALAELLQFHKTLKQPICPAPRSAPSGAPVTVTFEEGPPEG